jgi:transposase
MPKRGTYGEGRTAKQVRKAVDRHLKKGESVADLAKEYAVSRQTMYAWIESYRKKVMESANRAGKTPTQMEKESKVELVAKVQALTLENRKLLDKLFALMVKHKEI